MRASRRGKSKQTDGAGNACSIRTILQSSLADFVTTIDHEVCAGNERSFFGGEKEDCVSYLTGITYAIEEMFRTLLGEKLLQSHSNPFHMTL